jgi:hypothetical protein
MSGNGYQSGVAAPGAFPLELPASGEAHGVREGFAWGPQHVLLFCGLGWLLLGTLGAVVPQGVAMGLALSLAVLAALAVIRILRRRAGRVVLLPMADEVGVYRDGRFAYRFATSALRQDSWDWVYLTKMLILTGLLVLLTGGLLAVELRDLSPGVAPGATDLWLFAYLFGYAGFAFVAILRSQLLLVWYWLPEGPEGGERRVAFPRREARRLRPGILNGRPQGR